MTLIFMGSGWAPGKSFCHQWPKSEHSCSDWSKKLMSSSLMPEVLHPTVMKCLRHLLCIYTSTLQGVLLLRSLYKDQETFCIHTMIISLCIFLNESLKYWKYSAVFKPTSDIIQGEPNAKYECNKTLQSMYTSI